MSYFVLMDLASQREEQIAARARTSFVVDKPAAARRGRSSSSARTAARLRTREQRA